MTDVWFSRQETNTIHLDLDKIGVLRGKAEIMKYDLEDRLVRFAALIIEVAESMLDSKAGQHLAGQLIRSGTAPALMYGEAQGAESRSDFIHKMRIGLKELRETSINLKIGSVRNLAKSPNLLVALQENQELIAIFTTSVKTARSKQT